MDYSMKPSDSEDALRRRLGRHGQAITARVAFEEIFAFYADERADDVLIEKDGDMLLYEWGVYSFTGPESFQVGVTRQFIVTDEDEPYQLHLTLHFAPTDALRECGHGNEWCYSPNRLPAFTQFIESSIPFRAVADIEPLRVELRFEQC
jgi:hypothetical protein